MLVSGNLPLEESQRNGPFHPQSHPFGSRESQT
jgi:hypothetical protein